jgi:hypothetical protein
MRAAFGKEKSFIFTPLTWSTMSQQELTLASLLVGTGKSNAMKIGQRLYLPMSAMLPPPKSYQPRKTVCV